MMTVRLAGMLLVMALIGGCNPASDSAAEPHGVGSTPPPSRAPDSPPSHPRPTLALSRGYGPEPTSSPTAVLLPVGPTPSPTPHSVSGTASYYDDGAGLYAAVPSFTWGDKPYKVLVCRNPGTCVTVTVRDHCQCFVGTKNERVIDLSPAAFAKLAPLSRGLLAVVYQ